MPIEFHCEHCNSLIRLHDAEAGGSDKCPHCGGLVFFPGQAESKELPLVPLDEEEERRRRRMAHDDAEVQRRLWQERAKKNKMADRDLPRSAGRSGQPPPAIASKDLNLLVVNYVEAMSHGQLDKADSLSAQMAPHKKKVSAILDSLAHEDLAGYGMPSLPRPVLLGFLKQLRSRL